MEELKQIIYYFYYLKTVEKLYDLDCGMTVKDRDKIRKILYELIYLESKNNNVISIEKNINSEKFLFEPSLKDYRSLIITVMGEKVEIKKEMYMENEI